MSSSTEAFERIGIYLVHQAEGLFRFEQVQAHGTRVFEGKTLEEAVAAVESHLAQHPGASSAVISRSDGASESLDVTQRHSAEVGPSDLPTPAADAEAAAPAAEPASSDVVSEKVDVAPPAPAADAEPPAVES